MRSRVSTVVALVLMCLGATAEAATLLSFDELPHALPLSTEYSSLGVIFSSTAPIGASISSDPADSFALGETTAPFVFAIVAVPSTSTPSLPNKIIGAKFDAGGSLVQCERCGIRISFVDPIPTEVSLYITDPDGGQSAQFFGPSSSAFPEFVEFLDLGGISDIVLISRPSVGIGFDSLSFAAPVPEPPETTLVAMALIGWTVAEQRLRRRRPTRACS
jgi:hypothetical protein